MAQEETREALEPFGYYSPTIDVGSSGATEALVVTIRVQPGEPVRVRVVNKTDKPLSLHWHGVRPETDAVYATLRDRDKVLVTAD